METERRGINFYGTASGTVQHPATRLTFLEMLEDERKHLRELEQQWEKLIQADRKVLDAPEFLHFDYEELKRIFPSREDTRRKLSENLTEIEALQWQWEWKGMPIIFFGITPKSLKTPRAGMFS